MNEKKNAADLELRRPYLKRARRVVVKVGSAVLTTPSGLAREVMEGLAREIHFLRRSGRQVILVSSGAVAAGRKKMALGDRSLTLKEKQAAAALGQSGLMRAYEDIFEGLGQQTAQILLTHSDLSHRDRYLNIRNTLFTLLEWGAVPVINENDTVSVQELRFGDNDTLAALVTNMTEADLLICLTDVAGLHTANPCTDPAARLVYTVDRLDKGVKTMAGNVCGDLGTGGMRSKIMAAEAVAARGGCSFIGLGTQKDIIRKLFAGEPVGTFFLPRTEKIHSRKHWIAYALRPKGYLVLDPGACQALVEGGKSLLPSGILEVRGRFRIGDPVHCLDEAERVIAAGLVNYPSADIERIHGVHSSRIEEILGHKDSDEVIHRDNLVLLK